MQAGIILFLMFLCNTSNAQPSAWVAPAFLDTIKNPVRYGGPEMAEAKKIYDNTCWPCHGLDGRGDGPASLTMNPKPADHTSAAVQKESDGSLFYKISVGKGNMQPYSKVLTVKQRWSLVNYIRSLSAAGQKVPAQRTQN
jgi:mono/diheme cytochrome c family protein